VIDHTKKGSRFACVLLSIFFFLNLFVICSKSSYPAVAASSFIGVHGTEEAGTFSNPFAINSKEDLILLSRLVNEGNETYQTACYRLTADIVLNDGTFDSSGNFIQNTTHTTPEQWAPIGNSDFKFKGTFDGAGHEIKGIFMDSQEYDIGLFGYIEDATVLNVAVTGGYIKGVKYAGGIVGYAEDSRIVNCLNSSTVKARYAGGIAGRWKNSYVNNCVNAGSLSGSYQAGGIASYISDYSEISIFAHNYYLKTSSNMTYIPSSGKNTISDTANCFGYTNSQSAFNVAINGILYSGTLDVILNAGSDYYGEHYAMSLSGWQIKSGSPAFYTVNQFTITFDSAQNGGEDQTATVLADQGAEIDLTVIANKIGYRFLGWNTDPDARIGLENLTAESDITLYAIFAKTCNISFVDVSKTQNTEIVFYNSETHKNVFLPALSGKDSWLSLGWRSDALASREQYCGNSEIEITISDSLSFYAVYGRGITVGFDADGGTPEPSDISGTVYYNASNAISYFSLTLPAAPSKTGYDFIGWTNGTVTYSAGRTLNFYDSAQFSALYTEQADVEYIVNHHLEGLDGSYSIALSETLSGTPGTETNAAHYNFAGFNASDYEQDEINSDGNTVIDIYYVRNTYTFTFTDGQGNTLDAKDYRFGEEVIYISAPEKEGYTFDGWSEVLTLMPARNVTLYPAWTQNYYNIYYKLLSSDTDFYHTHSIGYGEAITLIVPAPERTGYTFTRWDCDYTVMPAQDITVLAIWEKNSYNITYKLLPTDEEAHFTQSVKFYEAISFSAPAPERTGYTFTRWDCDYTVMPANDITVYAVWEKNIYTVYYKLLPDGEVFESRNAAYNEEIPVLNLVPERRGYTFDGWRDLPGVMPADDVTVIAIWTARNDTVYTVNHHFETLTGGYETENENLSGTTDTMSSAAAKTVIGFTAQEFEQQKISGDGTTVIEIYYRRNSYTFTWKDRGAEVLTREYKFGEVMESVDAPVRAGYEFVGWSESFETMPSFDVTVNALWTAREDTVYTVNHHFETLSGGYETESENLIGTTDTATSAGQRNVDGFTAQSFGQKGINGDGTTVIDIYYLRNSYTVTYKDTLDESIIYGEVPYKYGDSITPIRVKAPVGYSFKGWRGLVESMPCKDLEVFAEWNPLRVRYTVVHYKESLAETYEYDNEVVLYGFSGEMTKAESLEHRGFTAIECEQRKIKGDGTTVVEVYYTRNSYKLIYKLDEETIFNEYYKYGQSTLIRNNLPQKKGYAFTDWSGEVPSVMPAEDVVIFAEWELKAPEITSQPTGLNAVYSGQEREITVEASHELEEVIYAYTWYKGEVEVYRGQILVVRNVADSGIYKCLVAVSDGENGQSVYSEEVTVIIQKARIDTSGLVFADKEVYHDEAEHTITVTGSAEGILSISYVNNAASQTGEYTATAKFETDPNYEPLPDMTAVLRIIENPADKTLVEPPAELDDNSVFVTPDALCGERIEVVISDCVICIEGTAVTGLKTMAQESSVVVSLGEEKTNIASLPENYASYRLSLTVAGECVDFNCPVRVSLPYALKAGENAQNIKVWYISDDTIAEVQDVVFKDGMVTFTANGFSMFAVGCENAAETVSDELFFDDRLLITGAAAIVCVVAIGAMVLASMRRKKKVKK